MSGITMSVAPPADALSSIARKRKPGGRVVARALVTTLETRQFPESQPRERGGSAAVCPPRGSAGFTSATSVACAAARVMAGGRAGDTRVRRTRSGGSEATRSVRSPKTRRQIRWSGRHAGAAGYGTTTGNTRACLVVETWSGASENGGAKCASVRCAARCARRLVQADGRGLR